LGILLNYDSRDNIFFPSKGILLETMLYKENALTGSQFNYSRISFDGSLYFPILIKHVLAINGVGIFMNGDVPFHQMATLGGTKKMRGYFDGKYRDKNLLLVQAEFRAQLFWRIGAVAFVGYGMVANKLTDFTNAELRYNYGGGLRFLLDKKQKINVRLDYGIGYTSNGFYLTISEAF
jgi:outer membrane protein assembly factor BamA